MREVRHRVFLKHSVSFLSHSVQKRQALDSRVIRPDGQAGIYSVQMASTSGYQDGEDEMAAYTIEQLRTLTAEQLISEHDRLAPQTQLGINYYLNEIARRELDRQSRDMLRYTNQVKWMTVIITVATLMNLVVAIAFYYK